MKQDLIDVVKALRKNMQEQDAYLDSLPGDISGMFFDNKYVTLQRVQCDILREALFGKAMPDVEWFLFEFVAGRSPGPHCVHEDGTEYTFKTDDDFYQYMKQL